MQPGNLLRHAGSVHRRGQRLPLPLQPCPIDQLLVEPGSADHTGPVRIGPTTNNQGNSLVGKYKVRGDVLAASVNYKSAR